MTTVLSTERQNGTKFAPLTYGAPAFKTASSVDLGVTSMHSTPPRIPEFARSLF